jgi:murein DD-endopeptidase MepM/ murein hydrolase activator NlpD
MAAAARLLAVTGALVAALALAGSSAAAARGSSDVAALQVALREKGFYQGAVDGFLGDSTIAALISFQRRAGLPPDGVPGPRTRQALGLLGGPELGARPLALGAVGWDVAELQFLLAWHGFPSGPFSVSFTPRLEAALRRFQRFARLPVVGVAGPATVDALQGPPPSSPLRLAWPLAAPLGDGFGPRGAGFHAGIDLTAPAGTPVQAAAAGRVVWAGPRGSFGNAVLIAHGRGVRTLYAHLSRVEVALGQRLAQGQEVGLVGASGRATGPHLHFEVRVRGAAVDPLSALP